MKNRIVRLPEVLQITGLSRYTLYKLEDVCEFPKRMKISGRAIGWYLSDINDWLKRKGEQP